MRKKKDNKWRGKERCWANSVPWIIAFLSRKSVFARNKRFPVKHSVSTINKYSNVSIIFCFNRLVSLSLFVRMCLSVCLCVSMCILHSIFIYWSKTRRRKIDPKNFAFSGALLSAINDDLEFKEKKLVLLANLFNCCSPILAKLLQISFMNW